MRYAVVSDIHANAEALKAVEADVQELRKSEEVLYWCLGDLVGYGPDPIFCLNWLRYRARLGQRWVAGNHDEWLIREVKVGDEAYASLSCHRDLLLAPEHSGLWNWFETELTAALVRDETGRELRSWAVELWGGLSLSFVHASTQALLRRGTYLFPWKRHALDVEFEELHARFGEAIASGSLYTVCLSCGHTHFPMLVTWQPDQGLALQPITYGRRIPLGPGWVAFNPGSVGQPRDGDPRAAYALVDLEASTVEFRRVAYDVQAAVDRLHQEGYPDTLADRLMSADGREELQLFAGVYRRPADLEPVVAPAGSPVSSP